MKNLLRTKTQRLIAFVSAEVVLAVIVMGIMKGWVQALMFLATLVGALAVFALVLWGIIWISKGDSR